jgi:hypothetical protein
MVDTDTTACNETHTLTAKQLRAVDLLASGNSEREVAEMVGCDRATLWRWRKRNAAFQGALNARRDELWSTSLDRLRALMPRALAVVETAIEAGDRQSALALLRLTGIGSVDLSRVGAVDPEVIAEVEQRDRAWREQERLRREQEQGDAAYRAAEAEVLAAERWSSLELRGQLAGVGIARP